MRKTVPIRIALCAAWLIVVGSGFAFLLEYQNSPGESGETPAAWPAASSLALDRASDTLIMFAHPQCPCSQASVEELNRIIARSDGKVAARVLFLEPRGFPADWTRSGLWKSVEAIPGVKPLEDPDGAQARLFGAETSGYVVVYNPSGRLLFKGGITGSRGHAGDNAGESAVAALLSGRGSGLRRTRVYGCPLQGQCEAPRGGGPN